MRRKTGMWVGIVVAGTVWVCAAALNAAPATRGEGAKNPPAKLDIQERPISSEVKAASSFAPVAKKVGGSVVTVFSTTVIRERPMWNPFSDDPFWRRFFGDNSGRSQPPRERRAQGLGSGVIVTPDGYILTANHVVDGAESVKVAMSDGQEYDARIVGNDPPTDIAVLKIEPKKDLPAITLADSDQLEVGDLVLAVGNPFGLGQTVTMGIVSALGRGGFGITAYENFIQTDAAINQGNSGGPLVDAEGRLVGINTAIFSRSGGFQGVGFAVPVNMARYVMDRLISDGKVTRGYLGINIQPLTPDLAKAFNLPDESSGVLVGGVTPNSAAQRAGVRDGDIIVELNGRRVSDPRNLQLMVSQTPPGKKVTLKVLRGEPGRKPVERTLTATLGELPEDMFAAGGPGGRLAPGESEMDALDGVEVADLDGRLRRQFNIPNEIRGALVTNVAEDSNAAEAGLRPGDVILEINRKAVQSADDAVELSNSATGKTILLRVWSRGMGGGIGGSRYLTVDNTKRK